MDDAQLMNMALNPDINIPELNKLSESERKILIDMVNELQATGSSDTLKSIWYEDYDEVPVDIDTFIDDERYLGNALGNTVYPYWRKVLREIFKPGAKYFEVVFTGAIGVGKSTVADIGIAYTLYKLLCLKNPQSYYGLTKSSIMTINFFNVSLDLSYGVAFSKLQAMLLESPWFLEHGEIIGTKNEVYVPGKNIQFKVGSQEEHALGQDVFCLTGDTEIMTTSGLKRLDEVGNNTIQVFQLNPNGSLELSTPCHVVPTKKTTELIKITLEDGTVIQGTPDHKLMLSDGTYKCMKDLTEEDDLAFVSESLNAL